MRVGSAILAGVVGGLVGFFAALIGSGMATGILTGVVTGAIIGFLFAIPPRDFDSPRIAIESLSPAGFMAGITASIACETGLVWGVFLAVIGWITGLVIPAMIAAINSSSN